MDLRLLVVPYDSGHLGWRMGAGPDRLLAAGLEQHLRTAGHTVSAERILLPADPPPAEVRAAFDLAALIGERVRDARAAGALPIVLAGNCISALGTLAGLADAQPAVLWLDAHADFNTPETTRSGMLDGMALAAATGRCWAGLASAIPGFRPVPAQNVCLIGTRDVDDAESDLLGDAHVAVVHADHADVRLPARLDAIRTRAETAYLHIDLDVLDPDEGRVNQFAAPGGFLLDQATSVLRAIRQRFRLGAVALTAYDPSHDADGRVARAAFALLDEVTGPA